MKSEGGSSKALFVDPAWDRMQREGRLPDGRPVVFLESVDSTNSYALAHAADLASGALVVAEAQTAGRGRLGRNWLSPPGCGLYVSLLLRPRLSGEDLPRVTLAAGVAVCKAIETVSGLFPRLKWPNDILLDGKKAGGILTETAGLVAGPADAPPLVVVGVGVNVNTTSELLETVPGKRATSLAAAAGRPLLRSGLLAALPLALDAAVGLLEAGRAPALLREWRALDGTLGRTLSWVTPGRQTVSGESLGIDDMGQLLIRDGEGRVHAVLSGDLQLITAQGQEPGSKEARHGSSSGSAPPEPEGPSPR